MSNVDPAQTDARASDTDAKRTLFLEAKEVLDEKSVVMLAFRALRIRWYRELLETIEREKKADLLARLKVLDAVPEEIKRFVSDYSVAMKNARRP